jgi:hypothetical protein
MTVLGAVTNPGLAEIIRGALAAEGIDCRLEGEGQAGLTGVLPIRLWVLASDLDHARQVMRQQEVELD